MKRRRQRHIAGIQRLIDLETQAWNAGDTETLTGLFHPHMVWPWPPHSRAHNPLAWEFVQGRYNKTRWKKRWQQLFDQYILVRNARKTLKIEVSAEGDGAFAVVAVNTLWQHKTTGKKMLWKGLAGKGYTKTKGGWKLIFHTGLLQYKGRAFPPGRRR
ncbi:nuclear transport factor 2 family protein [candidate division FCPU426 bacterium]|nr:nuclear transport factor 2 family protein [candidate division FCPU426 bacterium]